MRARTARANARMGNIQQARVQTRTENLKILYDFSACVLRLKFKIHRACL